MKVKVQIKQKEFEEAVVRANMTYLQLAKKLKINRIYLSNIKNDKFPEFRPSAKLRIKLMEILKVEFDDIFKISKSAKNGKK
jgi:transcriptional regulator with XRE-family HTH domain